jgi:hypothetical protein
MYQSTIVNTHPTRTIFAIWNLYPNPTSQLPLPSIRRNTRNNRSIGRRRRNILPREIRQESRISLLKSPRRPKPISLTHPSQIRTADRIGIRVRRRKQLSGNRALNYRRDILENIPLRKDVSAGADLERVPGAGVPVVVDLNNIVSGYSL